MKKERFVVVSLTGFAISADGWARQTGSKPSTEWYVLDRAWNHRMSGRFHGFAARLRAERRAASLNREHAT
jgi:hypothetical protein